MLIHYAHSQPVSSYKTKRRYHKYAGVASDSGVVSGTYLNPVSAHLLTIDHIGL